MIIAKWGRKEWSVSRSSILNISDMSFSYQQTADNNTSTEENKLTNQRGKELFPLKFSTILYAGAGVDVRAEIKDWESLVTSVNYFYLGGELLGPALQLRKVSVSDVKTDDSGKMIYAKLSFEFKEYDQETSSVKAKVPPLQITASQESKKIKKEENEALKISELNGIRIGDWVRFTGDTWGNGAKLKEGWADRSHEVTAIQGDSYILGFPNGICAWAYRKDITLD